MERFGVDLESIEITAAMRDLIRRRTDWIVHDYAAFDRSLRASVANAYIAGMNDALDTMTARTKT